MKVLKVKNSETKIPAPQADAQVAEDLCPKVSFITVEMYDKGGKELAINSTHVANQTGPFLFTVPKNVGAVIVRQKDAKGKLLKVSCGHHKHGKKEMTLSMMEIGL